MRASSSVRLLTLLRLIPSPFFSAFQLIVPLTKKKVAQRNNRKHQKSMEATYLYAISTIGKALFNRYTTFFVYVFDVLKAFLSFFKWLNMNLMFDRVVNTKITSNSNYTNNSTTINGDIQRFLERFWLSTLYLPACTHLYAGSIIIIICCFILFFSIIIILALLIRPVE